MPAMPSMCISELACDTTCRLVIIRFRERKTGPCFPLAVVCCAPHGTTFTLYPPGFAPYLRQPVVTCAPDGSKVAMDSAEPPSDPLRASFAGTLFDAALDAAEGIAWERCSSQNAIPDFYWGNQGRRLEETSRIVGVAMDLDDGLRDQISQALSVDALIVREHAKALKTRSGYRGVGAAIVAVLRALGRWTTAALRILTAGHLAGRFGKPLEWDPRRRCLRSLPFPPPGTAPPT